ncbi:hypothetical protein NLX86_32425 [Streptomyces sp. A3M-1-3]|uniref:hypothetical protein n=1 Tax=Streptomyces sp. A3M-1-3 TaxID=2962044 RepID=UPI0020B8983C|nr:hypothetical protein [Streptomyces sp. A3M-1-3]MCP3822621.1 hypothetical protein [Streptomyces sp. A3M-1-3]
MDTSGGAYFFLDHKDRVVLADSRQHILRIAHERTADGSWDGGVTSVCRVRCRGTRRGSVRVTDGRQSPAGLAADTGTRTVPLSYRTVGGAW